MTQIVHINLDQVTSIEVHLKRENRKLQFINHRKLFGLITIFKDGWYDRSRFESKFITAEPIPDEEHIPANTYIDNLTAYYLPHLEYNLSDRTTKIQFFKTESELRAEIVHLRTQLKLTTLINF